MEDDDPTDLPVSKTQLKREAHQAQDLGRALLDLGESDWARLALPERLISALEDARRIRAHGALKRQLQYIGKLMRSVDTAPIAEYLAALQRGRRASAQAHRTLEQWRDRLIDEGDAAIEALLREHPDIDARQLAGLVRQARTERKQNAAPKASRLLFRLLREILGDG